MDSGPSGDYYLDDHLYSPAALVNSSGTVVERYEYDVYGKCRIMDASYNSRSSTQYANPCLFTGRRLDILDTNGSLKIQYNRNRYYDPETGRWLTHDPLGITPALNTNNMFMPILQYLDGTNLYTYGQNSPTMRIDSLGLYCEDKCMWGDMKCKKLKVRILQPGHDNLQHASSVIDMNLGCDKDFDALDWVKLVKEIWDLVKQAKDPSKTVGIGLTSTIGLYTGWPVRVEMEYICCSKREPCFWAELVTWSWGKCFRWEWDDPVKKWAEATARTSGDIPEYDSAFGGYLSAMKNELRAAINEAIAKLETTAKKDCVAKARKEVCGSPPCARKNALENQLTSLSCDGAVGR